MCDSIAINRYMHGDMTGYMTIWLMCDSMAINRYFCIDMTGGVAI